MVPGGWSSNKIAVIGKTMDRVQHFAQQLANDLGSDYNVVIFKVDPAWSPAETLVRNELYVKSLQDLGYTFYDIGLEDTILSTGDDLLDYGQYYLNEIIEIFGGK
jgi:hypothetical protein